MTPLLSTADVSLLRNGDSIRTPRELSDARLSGWAAHRLIVRMQHHRRTTAANPSRSGLVRTNPSAAFDLPQLPQLPWPQPMQIPVPLRSRAPAGGGAAGRRHGRAWHRPAHPAPGIPWRGGGETSCLRWQRAAGQGSGGWMRGATVRTRG